MKYNLKNITVVCFVLLGLTYCADKKDDPSPATNNSTVERPLVLEATVSKSSFDTTVSSTRWKTLFVYGDLTNNLTKLERESDSVFIWEQVSVTKTVPTWKIAFCITKICFPPEKTSAEIVLKQKENTVFDFTIENMVNGYAESFGVGELTAEYIIYRKGMKKEDAVKLKLIVKSE